MIELLKALAARPSISGEEKEVAQYLETWLLSQGLRPFRVGNNLFCLKGSGPAVLLDAHMDTVKPADGWTRDPFTPVVEDGRLYGLGSNDCGGGLVSLLMVFLHLVKTPLPLGGVGGGLYNLIYLASCEEEVSGANGISSVLPLLPKIDVAIVGEPTGMQPAIAEKGLMVIDGVAHGKSGHAARNEGVNAIYDALEDLVWLRDYRFEKVSPLLGPTKMTVTVLHSGTQHNVVPDKCEFTIDVRTNEYYTNEEVFEFLQQHTKSELKARSFRLHSSSIPEDHPLIARCKSLGMQPFGSPTLSDQALMSFPSFKLGPGES